MKLYEIADAYHDFMYALESEELTDEQAIADTLEAIEATFTDKADSVACMIKSYEAEAEAIKAEAAKLTERARAKANLAERLRKYLAGNMLSVGVMKLESPRVKLSFRRSESVQIADGFVEAMRSAGDDRFLTYAAPTANKTAIKAAIKAGESVPFAELTERQNLQIK